MTLRDVRVRKKLHELDRSKASYPTVARTGDVRRTGKFPLIFDDTNTIIFKTDAPISYPTTFHTGSKFLTSDLASDISISKTGSVNPSAVEQWIPQRYESEQFTPFSEGNLAEFNHISTDFYKTGSSTEDVGLGFSSTLGSKTIIRLELPLTGRSTLLATTASSYYYDKSTKKFEARNTFSDTPGASSNDIFGICGETVNRARNIPQPREELLFGPLGKHSINIRNASILTTFPPVPAFSQIFFKSAQRPNTFVPYSSYLVSELTDPSSSNEILLKDIINQPFLVEKCIVEIPFEAGSGWFQDKTTMSAISQNIIDPQSAVDLGGPAITFAIFNSLRSGIKDLILSGTIIPENDNTEELAIQQIYSPPQSTSVNKRVRTLAGFKSFSKPSYVVKRPANSSFTGTLAIPLEAMSSVGINSAFFRLGPSFSYQNWQSASFERSGICIQDVAGRSKIGGEGGIENLTGRSIFGKTSFCPSLSNVNPRNLSLYQATQSAGDVPAYEDITYYTVEKHVKSPYLLYPQDKLFVTLSKYRAAYISSSVNLVNASPPPSTDGSYYYYLSSSHDVGIGTGSLKITLYGSLVRENSAVHDTLNSRLDTEQIHEMIGSELVVDEHEVYYLNELTGSYLDDYITGSIMSTGSFARQRLFSNISPESFGSKLINGSQGEPFDTTSFSKALISKGQVAMNPRYAQLNSSDERYFDSLTPDIPSFLEAAGGTYVGTLFGSMFVNEVTFGTHRDVVVNSFPFEPRFSRILRTKNDKTKFKIGTGNSGEAVRSVERGYTVFLSEQMYFIDISNNQQIPLLKDDLLKILFGFGRNNRSVDVGDGVSYPTGSYWGGPNFVGAKFQSGSSSSNVYVAPDISGWKYGLVNALPSFSKAIFRRNRHGQMRDMLEQRLDTKFFSDGSNQSVLEGPIKVRFTNSSNEVVLPESTYSSNLSPEVTSSVPYSDGLVRNREEPIVQANTNKTIIIL